MKVDLSCPVEVRGYALSGDGDAMRASIRLYNLTRRRVAWLEGAAGWFSASGKRMATPFRADSLRAPGESAFRIALETSRLPDANRLELRFSRVGFDDGDEWRAGDGPFADLEPLPAIAPPELDALRDFAGADAVCYPKQTSQIWRCVCGRLNPNDVDTCARCHRSHFAAIACTSDAVRSRAESTPAGQSYASEPELCAASGEEIEGRSIPRERAARLDSAANAEPCAASGKKIEGCSVSRERAARLDNAANAEPCAASGENLRGRAIPQMRAAGQDGINEPESCAASGEEIESRSVPRGHATAAKGSEARRRKGQTIPPSRTEDVRADEIDPLAGEPDGEFSGKELAALHAQYLRQRSRLLRRTAIAAVLVLILAVWFALRPSAPTHADFSETAADEAVSAEN